MAEVAEWVGITPAQVLAVASFYTMYKREPTGQYLISCCTSISCMLVGSDDVLHALEDESGVPHGETDAEGVISVEHAECIGACGGAPAVQVNYELIEGVTPEKARELVRWLRTASPPVVNTDEMQGLFGGKHFLRLGDQGSKSGRRAPTRPSSHWAPLPRPSGTDRDLSARRHSTDDRSSRRQPHDRALRGDRRLCPGAAGGDDDPYRTGRNDQGLGLCWAAGGAAFSAGLKWSFLAPARPAYLVVNADESEPGTFKDRQLLERDPHQMVEGIIIASVANEVHHAFIYIRGEYPKPARRVQTSGRRGICPGLSRKGNFRRLLRSRGDGPSGGRRLHLRGGDRPHQLPRGVAGRAPAEASLLPGGGRSLQQADHRQQRRNPLEPPLHPRSGDRGLHGPRSRRRTPGRSCSRFRAMSASRATTSFPTVSPGGN